MKNILEYIENKNVEFGQRKIFDWLKDERIEPEQRFSFAPYMAHFVFSFMDINRFVLRDLENAGGLQDLVNVHTNEDAHHWPWYLQDIKSMKFDKLQSFTDTLYFVWGDHCIKSRMITYEMAAIAKTASPREKIILVEVIEKTGNVFLGCTAAACRSAAGEQQYLYYGDHHLACETGHTMGTRNIESLLHAITLTSEELIAGRELIDRVYELYHDFVDEMYEFATNNDCQDLVRSEVYGSHINRQDVCAIPVAGPDGEAAALPSAQMVQ